MICRDYAALSALCALFGLAAGPGCDNAEASEPPQARRAADFRSERVEEALDAAERVVRTRGFTPDDDVWRGFLVHRDSDVLEMPMRAGTCYVVVGATSAALRELDLRVFDSDGGVVTRDARTEPGAALQYCPAQSGSYYLTARAASGSGLFAVRRYRGPTGLDIRLDDLFRGTGSPAP